MRPQNRVILLVLIMAGIVFSVELVSVTMLYRAAIKEETARLTETARSQARLIEAVARFDAVYSKDYPTGPVNATLSQIMDAHNNYEGFGETGEFTLSKREGDSIVFLLSHRHFDLQNPKPVPWNSTLAQPMREALSGNSGTIIGLDYRGETVLAAFEPVGELDLGIVAKIDLSEIRAPFFKAILVSGIFGVMSIIIGAGIFFRITNPILRGLSQTIINLKKTLAEVKTLRGILPLCSFCKKVRDDHGYWKQVDVYIQRYSDADISHSICPDCMKENYPEEFEAITKK